MVSPFYSIFDPFVFYQTKIINPGTDKRNIHTQSSLLNGTLTSICSVDSFSLCVFQSQQIFSIVSQLLQLSDANIVYITSKSLCDSADSFSILIFPTTFIAVEGECSVTCFLVKMRFFHSNVLHQSGNLIRSTFTNILLKRKMATENPVSCYSSS